MTTDNLRCQQTREECHSLSRELGAAGPAGDYKGHFLLSIYPGLLPTSGQARGPAKALG